VARKVGCFVWLSAEDIVAGKPSLMLMLLVGLMARDKTLHAHCTNSTGADHATAAPAAGERES